MTLGTRIRLALGAFALPACAGLGIAAAFFASALLGTDNRVIAWTVSVGPGDAPAVASGVTWPAVVPGEVPSTCPRSARPVVVEGFSGLASDEVRSRLERVSAEAGGWCHGPTWTNGTGRGGSAGFSMSTWVALFLIPLVAAAGFACSSRLGRLPDGGPDGSQRLRSASGKALVTVGSLGAAMLLYTAVEFGEEGPTYGLSSSVGSALDPGIALTVGLLLPVLEELVFRGWMLSVLWRSTNRYFALFASSLVFALAHVPHTGADWVLYGGMGIVLGLARMSTRTLLVPILVHVLWNTSNLLLFVLGGSG